MTTKEKAQYEFFNKQLDYLLKQNVKKDEELEQLRAKERVFDVLLHNAELIRQSHLGAGDQLVLLFKLDKFQYQNVYDLGKLLKEIELSIQRTIKLKKKPRKKKVANAK